MSSNGEIDTAFAAIVDQRIGGLIVQADQFFTVRRDQLVLLTTRHAIPTIFGWREFAVAGGLMSYGTNLRAAYRQVAVYAGRVLKGEKVTDIPVQQATAFEPVVNLKAAKALGVTYRPAFCSRRRGDRVSAPAASWCDPAGESPAQVRGSARLVASVAWPLATVVAKRTQRLHGVWD